MRLFIYSLSNGVSIDPPTPSGPFSLLDESFTSMPSDWVNNGFTVNNGLEASGTGGMGTNITYSSRSALDRHYGRIEVVVNDVASKFSVGKDQAFRGNLATADLSTNTLYLGIITVDGVEPIYEFSTPITIDINLGDTYSLEFRNDRNQVSVRFLNISDEQTYDEILRDYEVDDTFAGSKWGAPFAVFFKGDIKITNFSYVSLVNPTPKVMIIGDSFVEGYTMIDEPGGVKNTYSDKMYVSTGNNLIRSARGGNKAQDAVDYIDFEFNHINPTYTIIALGTNDGDYQEWETAYQRLIIKALDNNSTPVVCTVAPREGSTSIPQITDYVLNHLSQWYDVIDIAASVTLNNARDEWVPEYLSSDGVHPTVAGHQAMYDWIVANNNYLVTDVAVTVPIITVS